MKPERVLLLLVWVALAAGFIVWGTGGVGRQRLGAWIFVGGLGILCLPLLLWVIHFVSRRGGNDGAGRR